VAISAETIGVHKDARSDDLFIIISLSSSLLGGELFGLSLVRRASPFTIYFKRILKALNLHKKTEYTARIAPAQLGKATVNRYRRPAATGWDCFREWIYEKTWACMQASFIGYLALVRVSVSRSLRHLIDPPLKQITTKLISTDWM